ncbi:MAG TPA: TonB-dependent receptor [Flavobacteriaceae bacterium]|nr:TonB-dependent receptor [Flavobacteriaceae bacterium]
MKLRITLFLIALSTYCFGQDFGTIKGTLLDKETEQPLAFANIIVKDAAIGTISDFEGNYIIENISPGTYTLIYSFIGYKNVEKPGISIGPGDTKEIDISLQASASALEQVVVTSVASRSSQTALLLEQKGAIEIKENIGAVELSNLGIGDMASATTKIAGVSASENSGNIYVRGLGDRYLHTTLNGLPIPSDNVENKNIDLELFPTDIVESISISKTFSPETSADQVSGNINITTRELFGSSELSASIKSGINTNSFQNGAAENFKQTANFPDVQFGFYSKDIPTKKAMLHQSWNPTTTSLPIDREFSLTAGKRFGEKLEVLFTGSHSTEFNYREGIYRQYRRNFIHHSFENVEEWFTTVETTGMLNFNYEFNDNHSLSAVSLFINKLKDHIYEAGRNGEGFVFEETNPSENSAQFRRDQNTAQTRLWVNQLIGEHNLGEKNKLDWAIGYNMVDADEPNRIRNEFNFNENEIELGHTGGFQQRKSVQEIDDMEWNARIKDNFQVFDQENTKLDFSLGLNYRNKERNFFSQFFGIQENGNQLELSSLDNLNPVFTPENFNNGFYSIIERPRDTYDGKLESAAGFVMGNYKLGAFSFNIGARYQYSKIKVNYQFGNTSGISNSAEKSYSNIYPSLNIKYALNDRTNLRLAGSKTITLPEFKEIAPFEYVSPTGQVVRGNPNLEASTAFNLDLKWEFFPSNAELISLTGFYKNIQDPINKVQSRGSAGVLSYLNAGEKAEMYGLEFDTNLKLITASESRKYKLDLGLNATRMWHSQDLKENRDENGNLLNTFRYKNLTETGLEGASEWIFNASLNFATTNENKFRANISANYSSDKIYALGSPEIQTQSDLYYNDAIIEQGFVTLNTVISKELNENLQLKFSAKNLLNPKIERTQLVHPTNGTERNETVRSFRNGIVLGLGFSYDF